VSDVHRFFGHMLPPLAGVPARDLTPDEFAAAIQVHDEQAVHLRWTWAAQPAPILPPAPTPES
jgi:hypothetical protein